MKDKVEISLKTHRALNFRDDLDAIIAKLLEVPTHAFNILTHKMN